MKKIFILTFCLVASAFTYQSCTPVDNTAAWAKTDSISNATLMAYSDSLAMDCQDSMMAKAQMMADSMMDAYIYKKTGKKPAPKPAPPANPKADKMDNSKESSTQDKKDKMDNTQESTTDKKKDKMNKGKDTIPKF